MTEEQFQVLVKLLKQLIEELVLLRLPRASYEWRDNELIVTNFDD